MFVPHIFHQLPPRATTDNHTQLSKGTPTEAASLPHRHMRPDPIPSLGTNPHMGWTALSPQSCSFLFHEGKKWAPIHLLLKDSGGCYCFWIQSNHQARALAPCLTLPLSFPPSLSITLLLSPEFSSVVSRWSQAPRGELDSPLDAVGWSTGMWEILILKDTVWLSVGFSLRGHITQHSFCARHCANSFYMCYLISSSQQSCAGSYWLFLF